MTNHVFQVDRHMRPQNAANSVDPFNTLDVRELEPKLQDSSFSIIIYLMLFKEGEGEGRFKDILIGVGRLK